MQLVPFHALPRKGSGAAPSLLNLQVDAIYEGGNLGNTGDDPISRLLPGVGNQGGFRAAGKRGQEKLVALYSSGEDLDWPDQIDLASGRFTYHGDNKRPGRELHATPGGGNEALRRWFGHLHEQPHRRDSIPPILVFFKHPTPRSSRSVQFLGLAVPGYPGMTATQDLVATWKSEGGRRYQNYQASFTLLDVPTIPARWLEGLLSGAPGNGELAPPAYATWLRHGTYLPLRAPPVRHTRTEAEQEPASPERQEMLRTIYDWFHETPHAFEHFAAHVFSLLDDRVVVEEITRPSVDGGRDAIGHYRLGLASDQVKVTFALEAKCYRPSCAGGKPVRAGVHDIARLVSRIRHRQFGVLVTTSTIGGQAYREIREDGHPIIFIAGGDLCEILVGKGIRIQELRALLADQFPRPGRGD